MQNTNNSPRAVSKRTVSMKPSKSTPMPVIKRATKKEVAMGKKIEGGGKWFKKA